MTDYLGHPGLIQLRETYEKIHRKSVQRLGVVEQAPLLSAGLRQRAADLREEIDHAFDALLDDESRSAMAHFTEVTTRVTDFFDEVIAENEGLIDTLSAFLTRLEADTP
jgi:hypothetical protein